MMDVDISDIDHIILKCNDIGYLQINHENIIYLMNLFNMDEKYFYCYQAFLNEKSNSISFIFPESALSVFRITIKAKMMSIV